MTRKLTVVLLTATVLGLATAVFTYCSAQPATIRLRFTPMVGDKALVFNEPLYANPGGRGMFSVRDFLMYLSNVQLVGAAGSYNVPDSYHLARFDNASKTYEILIEAVPRDTYSRVILSIGVDQKANASIEPIGDLDPNGRMAWTWEVGYKFVLFEGSLLVDDELRPLVYHVGFSENRRTLQFDLPDPALLWSPEGLAFRVDLMTLFAGDQTVDMQALSDVKFDRGDARLLANNYASMISLLPSEMTRRGDARDSAATLVQGRPCANRSLESLLPPRLRALSVTSSQGWRCRCIATPVVGACRLLSYFNEIT